MAKKPIINPVSPGNNAAAINANLYRIQEAFDNTVSRDGSTPNHMLADFDMNSNDILNAGVIQTDQLLVRGVDFEDYIEDARNSADRADAAADRAEDEADRAALMASIAENYADQVERAVTQEQTTFLTVEGQTLYTHDTEGKEFNLAPSGCDLFGPSRDILVRGVDYGITPEGHILLAYEPDGYDLYVVNFLQRYTNDDVQQIILGTKENADRAEAAAGRAEAAAAIVLAVNTAADMVSGAFVAGDVVRTLGYYAPLDGGAGTYLVRAVDDGFSIPLSNGLFASLRDDFDIRKFGIRDGFEFDQTEEIRRMVAYADDRVYEIDFLNYRITTPKIVHYTTSRGSIIMGMAFHKVHDIKNLRIANDKGETLVQGTSPVLFLPKNNGVGAFKFTSSEIDPWVDDYYITSTEYDGMMLGFLATNHPDWDDYTRDTLTGYSFDMSGLNFTSPAVSYNISLADIFSPETRLSNLTGEYLGLYVNVFTKKLVASRVEGVWRDDLYATEGRLLVTNLIHEEPEITGKSVTQDNYSIFDCSCTKYTDGSPHVVYKHHSLGSITMEQFDYGRCVGAFQWYSGVTVDDLKDRIEVLNISDIPSTAGMMLGLEVGKFTLSGCPVSANFWLSANKFDEVRIRGSVKFQATLAHSTSPRTEVGKLIIDRVDGVDPIYGLVRNGNAYIDEIEIGEAVVDHASFIEARFKSVKVDRMFLNFDGTLVNTFYSRHDSGAFTPTVTVGNLTAARTVMDAFYRFEAGLPGTLSIKNSWLPDRISGGNATVTYQNTEIRRAVTFDPPSIAAGASVTTTVIISGVLSVGDVVTAAFSNYNADIEIYAVVSDGNSVTVKFKNTGAGAVDLASGTLTVLVRK